MAFPRRDRAADSRMGAAGGALSSFVLSHRALDRRSISSPHLHPVSSPTSAIPRRARGAESQKHDADCGGVRRARPVVLSLQGRIRPNLHATSSTPYLLPFGLVSGPLKSFRLAHLKSSFRLVRII